MPLLLDCTQICQVEYLTHSVMRCLVKTLKLPINRQSLIFAIKPEGVKINETNDQMS